MQTFRVFIPGYGNIYVREFSADLALDVARRYLRDNNITFEEPVAGQSQTQPTVTPASEGSIPPNDLYLNQAGDVLSGKPVGVVPPADGTGSGSGSDNSGSSTDGENPVDPTRQGPATKDPEVPTPTATSILDLIERERADPAAAFRSFASGIGLPTGGVVGNIINRTADPTLLRRLDAFNAVSPEGLLPAQGQEQSLTDFLSQSDIPSVGVTRGLGRAAFNSLENLGSAANTALTSPFQNLTSFDSGEGQAVRDALRAAITGRNASFGDLFGGTVDRELGRRFGDQTFAGNQPTNFIDFALNTVGLR